MAADWESTFKAWSKPSSDTEAEKCGNAETMIKAAIADHPALAGRSVRVFAQGSYRNNTNVRLSSDVDICVCCSDSLFTDFSSAEGFTKADVGLTSPAAYSYEQFRGDVEAALVAKFGGGAVERGNKAFDVHENSRRVDADVVACFEHRRYLRKRPDGTFYYLQGTELRADDGKAVVNWLQQHYDNGVTKNTATGSRYKWITRVLKRLRDKMHEDGVAAAKPIPSFLIECLAWNAPNDCYGRSTYEADVRAVLAHTFNHTLDDEKCREWGEVSELKYLFRAAQPWTRVEAHAFLDAAWNYVGFE